MFGSQNTSSPSTLPSQQHQQDSELEARLNYMFSKDCSPVKELRWWVNEYGEEQGLCRLTSTLISSLHLHIERNKSDGNLKSVDIEDTSPFLDTLCLWLEHVICSKHLLNVLQDTASFSESTAICKQQIKQAIGNEPQRVCSRAFRAGDIVWNCKQCQMDSTCVLCQQCFRESNHEGHDVYFYHVMTDAGGCCDCGDAGAWDPKGFCTRHGDNNSGQDVDPRTWLPDDMANNAKMIIDQVVRSIAKLSSCGRAELILEPSYDQLLERDVVGSNAYAQSVQRVQDYLQYACQWKFRHRGTKEDMAVPILLKNWFSRVEEHLRSPSSTRRVESFVLTAINVDNLDSCHGLIEDMHVPGGMFNPSARNLESIKVSVFIQRLADWLLKELCYASDSFSRITSHALTEWPSSCPEEQRQQEFLGYSLIPLKNLIVQDLKLPDSCSKSLRNLYIRLLVDGMFKERFAIAFAETYRESCQARVNRLPVLEISDVDTIFGLSVQFLNRHHHVLQLVHQHQFLTSILTSLHFTVKVCERTNKDGKTELDFFSTVLTHRKTKCLVTDLTYVLSTPGLSYYLLTEDPKHLETWFALMETVYGMHEQTRLVDTLAEKDERWVPAFNLSLSLMSLFCDITRYITFGETLSMISDDCETAKLVQQSLASNPNEDYGIWSHRLVSSCIQQVASILERKMKNGSSDFVITESVNIFGTHSYVAYDVATKPVTFHCLAQRFCGMVHSLCICSTLVAADYEDLCNIEADLAFWLFLIRQPVNTLVLFAQAHAGMWRRNPDVAAQVINYQSLPFISGMQLDVRLLQLAALVLPPDTLVNYIVESFALVDWISTTGQKEAGEDGDVGDSSSGSRSGPITEEQHGKLAESMVELLCVLVTELPRATPFALQREFSCSDINDARVVDEVNKLLRREIVHFLAVKKATFSTINDHCSHLRHFGVEVSTENIRSVLSLVSKEISRSDGLGAVQYDLRPEAWAEFDPLFYRLTRNDKDQARQRWLNGRVSPAVVKACFPGDSKPKNATQRTLPLPATSWDRDIHPGFNLVRRKLLGESSALFILIRQLLNKAFSPSFNVSLLANVLHLLTLQVYWYIDNATPLSHVLESGGSNQKSVLDCLLAFWYNKPEIDATSRASVRWILLKLCGMSPECKVIVKREFKSNKSALQAEKDKLSRKRKAQRNAMSAMRQSQESAFKAFAKEMEQESPSSELFRVDELDGSSSDLSKKTRLAKANSSIGDGRSMSLSGAEPNPPTSRDTNVPSAESLPDQEAAVEDQGPFILPGDQLETSRWLKQCNADRHIWKGPACVSCHERHGLNDGATCYIGFRQQNDSLVIGTEENTKKHGWCSYWADGEGRRSVVQMCGHAIHASCLEQYRSSIQSMPTNALDTDKDEFLCPLCKTLSNCEIPCVPLSLVYCPSDYYIRIKEGRMDSSTRDGTVVDPPSDWFSRFSDNISVQTSPMIEVCSKYLEPLGDSLQKMSDLYYKHKASIGFDPRFSHHSEEGRRRELDTMVLLDQGAGGGGSHLQHHQFSQDPIAVAFSLAMTYIAERETLLNDGDDIAVPTHVSRKFRKLFEACRANLVSNCGDGIKHLQSELYVLMSVKRTIGHHCVISQCPELVLILSTLIDCSKENVLETIKATYVLKLVQILMDLRPSDDEDRDESVVTFGDESFVGAVELRQFLLDKFERASETGANNSKVSINQSILAEWISDFLHVAQIALYVSDPNVRSLELASKSSIPGLISELELAKPEQILKHTGMVNIVNDWIDQVIVCMPTWVPRSLVSVDASFDSSAPLVCVKDVRSLTVRPLVNLRASYTEQYVEVHQGICSNCKDPAHDRAICLVCGENLLAGTCTRNVQSRSVELKGQCTRHVEEYHNGIGMVLLFKRSSSVLLINQANSAYWGSLYVDKNGDDQHVIPSLPMFLDEKRYERVKKLWRENGIPTTVSALRNTANILVRRNYY